MSPQPYARIAITLPVADLAAADRLARDQDRPRSWIIAEAIRQFAAPRGTGLGESRLRQLAADLRLTPEARVRAAEKTARAVPRHRRGPLRRVLSFDRYEDYLDWKRVDDATG